jgi:hypothetical protein
MSALGWAAPVVDAALLALLVLVLQRLGRDPGIAWRERESALRAIFDDLRGLVAQAEGLARDLDDKLAARAQQLRRLAEETAAAARACEASHAAVAAPTAPEHVPTAWGNAADTPAARDQASGDDLAARVRALARASLAVEDIARRLDVSAAEVRLLIAIDDTAANGAAHGAPAPALSRQE